MSRKVFTFFVYFLNRLVQNKQKKCTKRKHLSSWWQLHYAGFENIDIFERKRLSLDILEWGVTRAERRAFELVNDDECHCQECNTTCFLFAVSCECNDKLIVCLRHYTVLSGCAPEKHTLRRTASSGGFLVAVTS